MPLSSPRDTVSAEVTPPALVIRRESVKVLSIGKMMPLRTQMKRFLPGLPRSARIPTYYCFQASSNRSFEQRIGDSGVTECGGTFDTCRAGHAGRRAASVTTPGLGKVDSKFEAFGDQFVFLRADKGRVNLD